MASFNLGRIKGDAGPIGPQGEKGEKGDKGETGARGSDGLTPVFSVNETYTLSSNESARVEVDSSIPEEPKLTFYIPKGADGKDAMGDMLESIYDSTGKKSDIYKYADDLFELSFKKSGGVFAGKVRAYSENMSDSCVRNIVVAKNLPEEAINGDIGILLESVNALTLNDQAVGTVVMIKENETQVPYILAGKNYHKEGTVTLIRKELLPRVGKFSSTTGQDYDMSLADSYINNILYRELSPTLYDSIVLTDLGGLGARHIFLPSIEELNSLEYFSSNLKQTNLQGEGSPKEYWTRTLSSSGVSVINSFGEVNIMSATINAGYRPMIVMKGDAPVENTVYNSSHAVKVQEKKRGIYVFDNGIWKECFA